MGFFGSLIGYDQSMGALNAVLANNLIEKASASDKINIAVEVVNVISMGRPLKLDLILNDISKQNRVVQMNFIALACDNLYILPTTSNTSWTRIQNPYRIGEQVDSNHISAALNVIEKKYGLDVSWPGNSVVIDFKKMYKTGDIY